MKIAFIGQKGIPTTQGGVERHVEELATRLVRNGHEVLVYTRPTYVSKNLKKHKGVELISLPSIFTKHLDAISHTFVSCLNVRKQKVDVIHFHSIGPSLLIWFAKFLNPKVPVIATFHSQCYRHKKWGIIARTALRAGERVCCVASDELVVVSRNLKNRVFKKYKRASKYIPNGVPKYKQVPFFRAKKWGIEKKGDYILYVGRLMESKGVHFLIKAFNELKTDKRLVIVGDEVHTTGYRNYLEKLAKGNPNIIFTGNLKGDSIELAELFSNAYLFVHPSEIEGLSIALLESMSYGVATLVSDIPENMEVIQDVGFSFESGNIKDLKAKLEHLLNNPTKVERVASLAKKRAEKHYSWEAVSNAITDLYVDLNKENKQQVSFPRARYIIQVFKRIF